MSARDRWDRHVGPRGELHRSIWLAGFYRWCVLRGHPADGAHPLTGDRISGYTVEGRALSRAVHLAMARHYLGQARSLAAARAVLP